MGNSHKEREQKEAVFVESKEKAMDQTNSFLCIEAILIETSQPENLAAFYRQAFQLPAPVPQGEDHIGFPSTSLGVYLGFDRVQDSHGQAVKATSLWFRVQDIEASFQCLIQAGGRVKSSPCQQEGTERLATVFDPDGNVVGLIASS
jgi:predicted enzyme related to lactoylglutathione lyase